MKGLTVKYIEPECQTGVKVAEVSDLLRKFSDDHFKRFMTHPLQRRLEILKRLARKGEL